MWPDDMSDDEVQFYMDMDMYPCGCCMCCGCDCYAYDNEDQEYDVEYDYEEELPHVYVSVQFGNYANRSHIRCRGYWGIHDYREELEVMDDILTEIALFLKDEVPIGQHDCLVQIRAEYIPDPDLMLWIPDFEFTLLQSTGGKP